MTTQKLVSGMIAGWAGMLVFGFVIGIFTWFIGSIPGAIIGYIVGFRWGYNRVNSPDVPAGGAAWPDEAVWADDANDDSPWPVTVGDTAFLITGFFMWVWLSIALPNLLFGFTGPYRGHPYALVVILLGLLLSPLGGLLAQKAARRRVPSPQRDAIGVVVLIVFVMLIGQWWQWAEARDAAYSLATRGRAAPIWGQNE
jgi:hypothetical protein